MTPLADLPRFYHPEVIAPSTIELEEEDGRHAKVLRLSDGDQVHIVDGKGKLFLGEIEMLKRSSKVKVTELLIDESDERPVPLILALAPTKNTNRLEWAVEKAVEVGMTRIQLITCAHSERSKVRIDRLHRIAISALKQSKGLFMTQIQGPTEFQVLLKEASPLRWIAHCIEDLPRRSFDMLLNAPLDQGCLIAIGPEGDFSRQEVTDAERAGFVGLDLGQRRLRTETAAMAVAVAAALLRS